MWLEQLRHSWVKAVGLVLAFGLLISPLPGSRVEASPLLPVSALVAQVEPSIPAGQSDEENNSTPEATTTMPTIMTTIMPTMTTMPTIMPTVSPEFYEILQKEAKKQKASD